MILNILLVTVVLLLSCGNVSDANFDDDATVTAEDYEYAESVNSDGVYYDQVREKRTTKVRSRVIEAMLNTPMLTVNPNTPNFFDIIRDQYDLPKPFKGPLVEYDFIVVGAGSGGSVVASRLSETRKVSVLLLEAGLGESQLTDVPILAPLFQQTDYVWPYLMEPQPNVCLGMKAQRCFWPRGRAVGGSSVVNYMIYTRGTPTDWNRIAADGNYGWTYDDVIHYYKKSEAANLRGLKQSEWHGRDGEMSVEYIPFKSKLSRAFLDAGKHLGNKLVDYNSPNGFGFSFIQATMNNGRRQSTAKTFLHGHKKRKNLHILPGSTATKVLIDPITKNAYGVEFYRDGKKYRIRAKKEVILSAGPIESPHLLMLSGIGPKAHLASLEIPVIHDLKVGEVLYDHISFPGMTFTLNTTSVTLIEKQFANVANILQYMSYGDGPLSSIAGVETIGYIKTNVSKELGDLPDIELISSCAGFPSDDGQIVAKGLHMSDSLYNSVYRPLENKEVFTILFLLLHPKSKGYMKLKSKNFFDPPKLYGNYLTDRQDVATMVAAVRYIQKLIDTPPFQKYGAILHKTKFPTCKQYTFDSDDYWECAIRTLTSTVHHQIATCKMGPKSDPYSVVDPELKVYGVKSLRVIDSSVIPRTIAAHTNAPAIMIGEKGADMIKNTWEL